MTHFDDLRIIRTEDGSTTLFDPRLQVHYRSTQGARLESMHVFLAGTRLAERQFPWQLLELGFGTGRNFLETAMFFFQHADSSQAKLLYHSIDFRLISGDLFRSLYREEKEYSPQLVDWVASLLDEQRLEPMTSCFPFDPRLQLTLYPQHWRDVILPEDWCAHAFFHDPFAPDANPESWTTDYFRWAYRTLCSDGILATYSASTAIRMAMTEAGFFLAKRRGAGRKREMTLAALQTQPLAPFKLLKRDYYLKRLERLSKG